jgi:hypothetical protein
MVAGIIVRRSTPSDIEIDDRATTLALGSGPGSGCGHHSMLASLRVYGIMGRVCIP